MKKTALDQVRVHLAPLKGKKLEALAVKLNLSAATLRNVKKKDAGHNWATVEKLAKHFGVQP